jgi:hypothetical protein
LTWNRSAIINLSKGVQIWLIVKLLNLAYLIGITGTTVNPHVWLINFVSLVVEYGSNIVIQILYISSIEISLRDCIKDRRLRAIEPRLSFFSLSETAQNVILDHKSKGIKKSLDICNTELLLIIIKLIAICDVD